MCGMNAAATSGMSSLHCGIDLELLDRNLAEDLAGSTCLCTSV